MTIHAFDPTRRTNNTLVADCHHLGYINGTVLDLTHGDGKFWTHMLHVNLTTNDLFKPADNSEDFTATRWADNEWSTVILDPPYRLGGTPSTPKFEAAYGLDKGYQSVTNVRELIEAGTREACRIAHGHVIVKVQDQVTGGYLRAQTVWVINAAETVGARLVDTLHVIGGRAQPPGRTQRRARHSYSTAIILRPAK